MIIIFNTILEQLGLIPTGDTNILTHDWDIMIVYDNY